MWKSNLICSGSRVLARRIPQMEWGWVDLSFDACVDIYLENVIHIVRRKMGRIVLAKKLFNPAARLIMQMAGVASQRKLIAPGPRTDGIESVAH